tara:strand:- start:297 stop:2057 length:1761 start_codon:yes stop_codon:yes gene_type:complete
MSIYINMRNELNKYHNLLTEERFNPTGACVLPTLDWLKKQTAHIGRKEGEGIEPSKEIDLENTLLKEQQWTDPNTTSQWHLWECCQPGGWSYSSNAIAAQPPCGPRSYISGPATTWAQVNNFTANANWTLDSVQAFFDYMQSQVGTIVPGTIINMTEHACYGNFTACIRYVGTSPTSQGWTTFNSSNGFSANSAHEDCNDCNGGVNPLTQACIDPTAQNYDSTATVDCVGVTGGNDYSCCWYGPPSEGCMDPLGVNYSTNYTSDCTNLCGTPTCCCWYGYPTCKDPAAYNTSTWGPMDCAGNLPGTPAYTALGPYGATGCCIYQGCTHPAATNFDPQANIDCHPHGNHSWIVPDWDCCKFPEPTAGCQNSNALNYDPNANADCLGDWTNNHWIAYYGPTGGNESCCQYCMDDGTQPWSQFPGTSATNFDPTATTDCSGGNGSDTSCCNYPDPCDTLPPNSPYLVWNSIECKRCLNDPNVSINCPCCPDEPIIPDTWDCVLQQSWEAAIPDQYKCIMRTDGSGQFTSLQNCEANCDTTGHILTPGGPIGPIDPIDLDPALPLKKAPVKTPERDELKEEINRIKGLIK